MLKESILNGKRLLAVAEEPGALVALEEIILETCPNCKFDKAITYKDAAEKMVSWNYDLVILGTMNGCGFDLLDLAISRDFPVTMLTAYALPRGALGHFIQTLSQSFFPREKVGDIVPFLEDTLTYEYLPGGQHFFKKLGRFFANTFENFKERSGINFFLDVRHKMKTMGYRR